MDIGERIKILRKNMGYTQKMLAEKSGVAAVSIQQYERGVRQPRIEQLQHIASALGISLSDLLGTSDSIQEAFFGKLLESQQHFNASKEAEGPYTRISEQVQAIMAYTEAQELAQQSNAIEEQKREKRKETLSAVYDKLNSICQEKVLGYAEGLAKDEENLVQYLDLPSLMPDSLENKNIPQPEPGQKSDTE